MFGQHTPSDQRHYHKHSEHREEHCRNDADPNSPAVWHCLVPRFVLVAGLDDEVDNHKEGDSHQGRDDLHAQEESARAGQRRTHPRAGHKLIRTQLQVCILIGGMVRHAPDHIIVLIMLTSVCHAINDAVALANSKTNQT